MAALIPGGNVSRYGGGLQTSIDIGAKLAALSFSTASGVHIASGSTEILSARSTRRMLSICNITSGTTTRIDISFGTAGAANKGIPLWPKDRITFDNLSCVVEKVYARLTGVAGANLSIQEAD